MDNDFVLKHVDRTEKARGAEIRGFAYDTGGGGNDHHHHLD